MGMLFVSSTVSAHEVKTPKRLQVHFDEMGVEVRMTYTVQPGLAAVQLREDFDRNRDGRLEVSELQRLQRRLVGKAMFALGLKLDGKRLTPQSQEFRLKGGQDRVSSGRSLVLVGVVRYRAPWVEKAQVLRLEDRFPDPAFRIHGECHSGRVSVSPCEEFVLDRNQERVFRVSIPPTKALK